MAVDLQTVSLMSTYRVGFLPPASGSLGPGELYVEVMPPGGGAPRLWVGIPKTLDFDGHVGLLAAASTAADIAPINLDIPYCSQSGATLTCTMGNWTGKPDTYAWQWQLDGTTDVGDGTDTYTPAPEDFGHTATCIVTASNASGATAAPPSNGVVVVDPADIDEGGEPS